MNRNQLDDNLTAYECGHCFGRWISSYQYWQWKEKSGKSLNEILPEINPELSVEDSRKAKLCPECGHFLRRFPVGRNVSFSLDHCGNCGGMWFDKNEWETLKSLHLHDDVHRIFSEIWQNQVRDEEHAKSLESLYVTKFGKDDFQKIKDIKQWIENHALSSELMAFLKT